MYKLCIKRVLDLIVSGLLLLILTPIFVIVSVLIKIDSRGNVFFTQKRIGLNGVPFKIFKFRTMVNNAESIGPKFTSKNDSRVTKIGKILRDSSLDELPQLINVFIGDMSLVGPRPDLYNEDLDEFLIFRSTVRPGITGLSQVNGRSNLSIQERMRYDRMYVEKYSFLMDIRILFKTVFVVFSKNGTN